MVLEIWEMAKAILRMITKLTRLKKMKSQTQIKMGPIRQY